MSLTEEQIKKRLLKKWRCILTKYTKLINNNFIRVRTRGNTRVITNCEGNRDYYLNQIENAKKIIAKLS